MRYINASPEAGKAFYLKHPHGSVTMLNLLKFKEKADYSGLENIKPEKEISGREAYSAYINYTTPLLAKAGSQLLFIGAASSYLIGPESEGWDMVLLVKHHSAKSFIEFANDPEYKKIEGHRTAAIEDSRLLPIKEISSNL